jgi:hypothetical protein
LGAIQAHLKNKIGLIAIGPLKKEDTLFNCRDVQSPGDPPEGYPK